MKPHNTQYSYPCRTLFKNPSKEPLFRQEMEGKVDALKATSAGLSTEPGA